MTDYLPDDSFLNSLPHFVAVQYQRALRASTPQEQVDEALHAYELGLRALAIGLVSQYLIRDSEVIKDTELSQYLYWKLPVATLDVWQRVLFDTLRVYGGQRSMFFMPQLYDFYWDSETVPLHPRPFVEEPFSRLTQMHFDLRYGKRPTTPAQWQALRDEAMALLEKILGGFAFWQDYTLIRITGKDNSKYTYDIHEGLEVVAATQPLMTESDLTPGWFYLSRRNEDFLLMHPMLVFWDESTAGTTPVQRSFDTAVFERFDKHTLSYLLAAMWSKVPDEKRVTDFVRTVFHTIENLKRQKLEIEQLAWWQLRDIVKDISSNRMGSAEREYQSGLYVQRDETKQEFERFLASDSVAFVLTGRSGVGKSNFLLSLAEEYHWRRPDICLLMYNGAMWDTAARLDDIVGRDFANHWENWSQRAGDKGRTIWQEIAGIEGIRDQKVVLCIDAINENTEAKVLLRQINELVQQVPGHWTWLKVVITSRPEAWRAIKQGVVLADGRYYRAETSDQLGIELERFSVSTQLEQFSRDELREAYANYAGVYHLQTPYDDVPPNVRSVLRDPLALRLVAATYEGQAIPAHIREVEIFTAYLDRLLKLGRLRREDLELLQRELMPLMIHEGHLENSILGSEIGRHKTSDDRAMHDLVHSDAVLSSGEKVRQSFFNLEETDVMVRRGDPKSYEIAFKYERFYDHFGSQRLLEMMSDSTGDLKRRTLAYRDLVTTIREKPFLWGAVHNALLHDVAALPMGKDLAVALAQSQDSRTAELVTSVLELRNEDDPEQVRAICVSLLEAKDQDEGSRAAPEPASGVADGAQRGGISRSSGVHAGKRLAVSMAQKARFDDILEQAACAKSPAVRALAAQYIYYLWDVDKELGFSVIQRISERASGRFGLPNRAALESCLGVSLMIVFWNFKDLAHRQSYFTRLQHIWRQPIEDLLHIRADDGRVADWTKRNAREVAMRLMVGVATALAGQAGESGAIFSVDDMKAFFPPNEERKALIIQLLRHMHVGQGNGVSELSLLDTVPEAMQDRDLLVTYAAFLALVCYVLYPPERARTLQIAEELFAEGIAHPPPLAVKDGSPAAPMVPVLVWCVRNSIYGFRFAGETLTKDDILLEEVTLMGDLIRRFADAYHSRSSSQRARFRNPDLGMYMAFYYRYHGNVDAELLHYLVDKALDEKDLPGLKLYIFECTDLGIHPAWGLSQASCQILSMIMKATKGHECAADLAEPLISAFARVRVYHSAVVDDFLAELPDHEMSPETKKAIEMHGTDESLGMLLGTSAAWFARDILIDENPFMRRMLEWLLVQATESSSLNEWVILLVKQIVNVAYGQRVFQVRGAENLMPG